jgi:xanthine/uracil/vitamin C permease (AzgA family)
MKKALRFKPLKQPPVMARFIYLFITIFLWFWAIVGIIMVGIAILEMLGLIKLNRPIL